MQSHPVIFMVGSVRSGTSMLRLMLDHHPEIAFNLESEYLVSQIDGNGRFPEIEQYRDWLAEDRVFQHSQFVVDASLDYFNLVNDFLRQKRERAGKRIVGATVHNDFAKLRLVWPEAKYLYVLRDGRDVANSVMRMGWAGNVYVAADWWARAEQEWEACKRALHAGSWMEVRYEDLVTDPKSMLAKICTFIGVDYDGGMLNYANHSTYDAPDPKLCYQWKKRMPQADLQALEEKIGDQLLARGYPLSGYPRISLSPIGRWLVRAQSKIGTLAFRVRRFGWMLTTLEITSRRLGIKSLHRIAIREGSRIQDKHLK